MVCDRCGSGNPDGQRFCGGCGAQLAEAESPREVRKVVTVLFCDVTGSTALGERVDPEALRQVMQRYFDAIRTAIERHGGTVEKFIGDAAMAVFGIPRVHEDDALRAVRAAAEVRGRLPELAAELGVELTFRTGINTGEVVAGEGQTLATGDAVNVAARLEQAAATGEILLGEETYRLVRDAVEVEAVEPLALKGKSAPVPAYRLLSIDPQAAGFARRPDAPLVGRVRERALLLQAYERTVAESSCQLVTVLGPAGVGKSRLVGDFLEGAAETALIVRGRCLNYGDGITFWPLVEVLKQLGHEAESTLEHLVEGTTASPAELFWEVRRLLETFARERPLVVVFDDLHWGQPMLLDLLDHVADLSRDAPILLLCVARPELLDERPGWGGGKLNATTTLLDALPPGDCERLLDALGDGLDTAARARIVEASEGNPLFLEEMAALVQEGGGDVVPSSIQALLAARLDRLGREERSVLERGSVEGKVFHRDAVRELAPDPARADVETHLAALIRKELIRPAQAILGHEAFRFRHLLIRDAAYDALPKEVRAELHERFAGWLEQHAGELVERDEILGYHLEQAVRYRRQLGRDPDRALADRGAELLLRAGVRASARWDWSASARLLERASQLAATAALRDRVLVPLAHTLIHLAEFERAESIVTEAEAAADQAVRANARVARLALEVFVEPTALTEQRLDEAIAELDRLEEHEGLARAWAVMAQFQWLRSSGERTLSALDRAIEHNARAGRPPTPYYPGWRLAALLHGPFEPALALAELEELDRRFPGMPAYPFTHMMIAEAAGDLASGREYAAQARAAFHARGEHVLEVALGQTAGRIELRAGNLDEAERLLRESIEELDRLGERIFLPTNKAILAEVLLAQGRLDEAEQVALEVEQTSAPEDVLNFALTLAVRARVALARGEAGAETLAQAAVDAADRSDFPVYRGEARLALATVCAASRPAVAAQAAREALSLFELKGHVHLAGEAQRVLAQLDGTRAG